MNKLVFVCRHVRNRSREVALIAHHSDGMWQITCGETDHPTDWAELYEAEEDDLKYINESVPRDLKFVERGWLADKVNGVWRHYNHDD